VPFCYAIKKYSRSVTPSKNGYTLVTHYLSPTIYLFSFLCLYRVLLNPVFTPPVFGACGALILAVAAGGGGPAVAPPPGPRFQFPISNSNFLKFVLYGGEIQLVTIKRSLIASHIFLITVSWSSPLCCQFSIFLSRYPY